MEQLGFGPLDRKLKTNNDFDEELCFSKVNGEKINNMYTCACPCQTCEDRFIPPQPERLRSSIVMERN